MLTTYLSEYEQKLYAAVSDPELDVFLQEVRAKFDNRYFIQEYIFKTKKVFRKETIQKRYTLYVGAAAEVQIINFASEKEAGFNTTVHKSYIITYFFGLLNGLQYAETLSAKK